MINWVILSGLPASGKTFWANNFKRIYSIITPGRDKFCRVLSLDSLNNSRKIDLNHPGYNYLITDSYVIIDGLFLTNSEIIDTISTIPDDCVKSITIIHWLENRNNCYINDFSRRTTPSTHSIETFPLEIPDAALIKEQTGFDVVVKFKKVKQYPVKLDNAGCLVSPIYSIGYNDDIPEEIPNITELDAFLNENYPALTYKDYIEVIKPLIKVKKKESFEYYTGQTITYWYSVNYKKLCKALEPLNLKKKED